VSVSEDEPARRQALHAVFDVRLGVVFILACTREPVEDPGSVRVDLQALNVPLLMVSRPSQNASGATLGSACFETTAAA
jgi:hypothetical protein